MTGRTLSWCSESALLQQVGDGVGEPAEHDPAVAVAVTERQDVGARSNASLGDNTEWQLELTLVVDAELGRFPERGKNAARSRREP
jgi:hypothetical protein